MLKRLFGVCRRVLVWLWVILLILVGAKLAHQNQQLLEVSVLAWQLPEVSVGVVITLSFLAGVAFSLLALLPGFYFLKLKLRRANSKRHMDNGGTETVSERPLL